MALYRINNPLRKDLKYKHFNFIINNYFTSRILNVIEKYIYKISIIPKEIMLEITDRCNLNCDFCFNKLYVAKKRDGKELDTKSIKQIIDKVKASGVKIIRFTGGEPLLRKDIFELMAFAFQKNLKVWLNTNATLINRENVRKIVKYVDNVLIPLNSFDIQHERRVTGSNSFKSKLKGIILLKKYGIRYLRCGTVATKENILNLEKLHNLVKRLGISDWELFRVIPLENHSLPLNNDDVALLVEKLLKISEQENKSYKIANAIPFCSYDPEKVRKVALGSFADDGHIRFVINTSGYARPMYYLNENIGNILQSDIVIMWNNKFMKRMRKLCFVPEACKRCQYLRVCKGGSRSVSKIVTGSYKGLDYLARPNII